VILAYLLQMLGGLAVLLFGIDMLSTGTEQVAGRRIQTWLERLTNRRLKAAGFGFVATAILQSSSLLMVTMIGLINARLFTLEQAVGVMMGQEIGTTLTGQLIAFDVGKFLFALLIVGYGIRTLRPEKQWQAVGTAVLGLGIIFLGLETVKAGVTPLAEVPQVRSWLTTMSVPWYSSSRSSSTSSVSTSRSLVGSSRIRKLLGFVKSRARITRLRSPPDSDFTGVMARFALKRKPRR